MLNENIKYFRKKKGYTQETLAGELDVVRQTVSKWEKGYSVPDAVMLERIADLFEISVSELLGDNQENPEKNLDLKRISEQLSILNSQFAKELSRKRRNRKILLSVIAVLFAALLLLLTLVFPVREEARFDEDTNSLVICDIDEKLNKAVSDAILLNNGSSYLSGECKTESHFVFGTDYNGDFVSVYLLEQYVEFGFCNGFFTNVSGGSVPAVFKFAKIDGDYQFVESKYASDGSLYVSSIKEMFPKKTAKQVLKGLSKEDGELMWEENVRQAQNYLKEINRDATVCEYGDIQIKLLSDLQIDGEVINKVMNTAREYDFFIGNHEKIENKKRYVYQTAYDEQNGLITFSKFEYDTNKIIEFYAFDVTTGETAKNVKKPDNVKLIKGKLAVQ